MAELESQSKLQVTNTLTRKKEPFEPREAGKVTMYVCGMTPYDSMHVGHARTFLIYDVMRRYLEYRGYSVLHVQNVTDVEDKIIRRAQEVGMPPLELAERYHQESVEDLRDFGLLPPHIMPRVTENIPSIVEIVCALVKNGYAYVMDGNVYFDVSRYEEAFGSYGQLSGRDRDELIAGARVEVDERKQDPMDFALWKASKEGEPSWESPWGKGRPGWHIECTAMSVKYLGSGFDMHGGAVDLIFPHHENELAQTQAYTGVVPAVRYWIHSGVVTVQGGKMSKSLGNFVVFRDALRKHGANALKLTSLTTHYRSPMDYSDERVQQAKAALERVRITLRELRTRLAEPSYEERKPNKQGEQGEQGELRAGLHGARFRREGSEQGEQGELRAGQEAAQQLQARVEETKQVFLQAMDDDFNTARAIAALFELVGDVNAFLKRREARSLSERDKLALRASKQMIVELFGVFGITGLEEEEKLPDLTERLIELLINVRQMMREKKEFEAADKIRSSLHELGIILEDKPQGTVWRQAE